MAARLTADTALSVCPLMVTFLTTGCAAAVYEVMLAGKLTYLTFAVEPTVFTVCTAVFTLARYEVVLTSQCAYRADSVYKVMLAKGVANFA